MVEMPLKLRLDMLVLDHLMEPAKNTSALVISLIHALILGT
jgi:hypothetical protein